MYSTSRTWRRPPQIVRRPFKSPLSRANGATPTSAAIALTADLAELRQQADQGGDRNLADTGHGHQESGARLPDRAGFEALCDRVLERGQRVLEPSDTRLERGPDEGLRGPPQAVAVGLDQPGELAPAQHQGRQRLIGRRTWPPCCRPQTFAPRVGPPGRPRQAPSAST